MKWFYQYLPLDSCSSMNGITYCLSDFNDGANQPGYTKIFENLYFRDPTQKVERYTRFMDFYFQMLSLFSYCGLAIIKMG
jgi:hypothetical protein